MSERWGLALGSALTATAEAKRLARPHETYLSLLPMYSLLPM
jgi:hypothetical protein